jgi:hypothetical protein
MARTPSTSPRNTDEPRTLAELLFPLSDPLQRKLLEEYRVEYETEFGPTDLTKRYTSTWPAEQQDWLVQHDSKRWFDGLPPFAKAFLHGKLQLAAERGKLDDAPDRLLRLYVSGMMKLDDEAPTRGR